MFIFLLDISAPGGGAVGVGLALAFLLAFVALALIVFKLLRRVLKMAFRLAVVGVILIVGLAGSVSLYYFATGAASKTRPPHTRRR